MGLNHVLASLLTAVMFATGIYATYRYLTRPALPSREQRTMVRSAQHAVRGAVWSHACWGFDRDRCVARTRCE